MKGSNKMIYYVEEYFTRKMLAKLGYSFSTEELSSADVDAFNIIETVISKHQSDQNKKVNRGRRHGR